MQLVHREDALDQCALLTQPHCRLLTVEAPAGYGKTVLATQFAETLESPVIKISCTPAMADPVILVESIAELPNSPLSNDDIRQLVAAACRGATQWEAATTAATALCDILKELPADPILFIFDDLHDLPSESAALQFLRIFIDNMPPNVRIMLLARTYPLLNGRKLVDPGEALRIDKEIMSMTPEEIQAMCKNMNREISLDEAYRLHGLTEGWAAGITLINRGSGHTKSPSPTTNGPLLDTYFHSLCLAQTDRETRRQFIMLSLSDTITEDQATATGMDKGFSMLKKLAHENTFVHTRQGADGPLFHIHHLFRDSLRRAASEYPQEERTEFLRALGMWHFEEGRTEAGLTYVARARDWSALSQVLSQTLPLMVLKNRTSWLGNLLSECPTEILKAHGWLGMALAHATTMSDPAFSRKLLDEAQKNLVQQGDEKGELLANALICRHLLFITPNMRLLGKIALRNMQLLGQVADLDAVMLFFLSYQTNIAITYAYGDTSTASRLSAISQKAAHALNIDNTVENALNISYFHALRGDLRRSLETLDAYFVHLNSPRQCPSTRFSMATVFTNFILMRGDLDAYKISRDDTGDMFPELSAHTFLGGFVHIWDMDVLFTHSEFDRVLQYSQTAQTLPNCSIRHLVSQCLHYQALSLSHLNRHEEALEVALKAVRTRAREGGTFFICLTRIALGITLARAGKTDSAKKVFASAEKLCNKLNENYLRPLIHANRASMYLELGEKKLMLASIQELLDSLNHTGNMHFFFWNNEQMKTLLQIAVKSNIHTKLAQRIARRRLECVLLDDGQKVPLLRLHKTPSDNVTLTGDGKELLGTELSVQQSAILQKLVDSPEFCVETEGLIVEFWPDDPFDKGRKKLDTAISRLRKTIANIFGQTAGKQCLKTRGGTLHLHHCESAEQRVLKLMHEGRTLSSRARYWQAHMAIMKGCSLLNQDHPAPEQLSPKAAEDIAGILLFWADWLERSNLSEKALHCIAAGLRAVPAHDGLHTLRCGILHRLKQPARLEQAIAEYAQELSKAGYSSSEAKETARNIPFTANFSPN